jgi:hypothetical protein
VTAFLEEYYNHNIEGARSILWLSRQFRLIRPEARGKIGGKKNG